MTPFTSLVVLLFVLAIGLVILGGGLCNAAAKKRPTPPVRAPKNAAPEPSTPPLAVPGRALSPAELCAVISCTNPWTVKIGDFFVCADHDHRAPFDRTIDPELVSDEVETWLRRSAS